MRKIFFKSLLTVFALGVTLASCNNENDVPEAPQKKGNVFMKLNLGQKVDTRASDTPLTTGTTAKVNSLHIYFYKDGDKSIQKYLKVDNSTTPSITDLTTGAQIADVPAVADKVLVRGNLPAGVSLPMSGLITGVENVEVEITTQNDKDNILLGHIAVAIQTYAAGGGAAPIAGMQVGDKYAEIQLEPGVARIEIEGLQAANGSAISSFSLDGIYLTNFYQKLKMGDGSSVTQVQYGADPTKYDENAAGTLYTTANKDKLFDKFAASMAASGSPLAVTPNPSTNRWVYHVFSNDATKANDQLQLVFKLSNLQASAGSGVNFPAGAQFLTVRGFKDNAGNIVKLEKGKIYTISKTDFEFDESRLSTVPNTNAVGVWLKVTVKPWTVVAVKPNL